MPAENKDCPFCGSSLVNEIDLMLMSDLHKLECSVCGASVHGDTLLHARAAWNRRAGQGEVTPSASTNTQKPCASQIAQQFTVSLSQFDKGNCTKDNFIEYCCGVVEQLRLL